ncbi:MAG: regulatory protein RecX [Luteibaculum sp.]
MVISKARDYGFSYPEAEELLYDLVQGNFVDDARFAAAFVNDRIKFNGWGKFKIRNALFENGLSAKTADYALKNFPQEEYLAKLRELIEKKGHFYSENPSAANKSKLLKYLQGKGFELELIIEELNES